MDGFSTLISDLGFAVAVAGFLIWFIAFDMKRAIKSQEKTMDELRKTVYLLSFIVARQGGVDFDEAKKVANIASCE